jgi:hypothetical protein
MRGVGRPMSADAHKGGIKCRVGEDEILSAKKGNWELF